MFLKRLELKGFKSFPEKTVLEFDMGITAVVGPNGSGKSNISDAVRWVLGEQSVKNLRGSNKMEDVIFAGTQNRTKLGFAEVSMVIDNSDSIFDIPYNEVSVTRRLYRSGESDFLINGSACRLKDIYELFMDTGIGKEGYSIIGQGRIDEILSTKSEDRRNIFEEAAGIVKFKTRRFETEKKLEKEKQNLIRINDIISELESQIEPLKIQSEKTKKYLILTDKLKVIQVNVFLSDINKLDSQLTDNQKNISDINLEILDAEKKIPLFEQTKNNLKNQIRKISYDIQILNSDLSEIRSESEQTENDIKFISQQIEYLNKNISDFQSEINELQKNISIKKDNIKFNDSKKNAAFLELKSKGELLKKFQDEFQSVMSSLDEKEEIIDKYNSQIIDKMNSRSEIKINIESINFHLSQMSQRKISLENEIDSLLSHKNDKNTRLLVLKTSLEELQKNEASLEKQLNSLSQKKLASEKEINDLYIKRDAINKNINDSSSKLKILSEFEKDYQGYYESVKAVLKQKKIKNPLFSGIQGAVGELLSVESNFETAIETALGGSIQNIVTKTESDAGAAINFLKQNKKGRATFLPMTSVKGKELPENIKSQILNENGVIDFAKNIVSYSYEYENIFSNLLSKVVVIDNFDNAANFAKKYKYSYKIVTIDGELFNPGGSISGGSINRKATGIFSRTREIKSLKNKISQFNLKLDDLNSYISKTEKQQSQIQNTIDDIKLNFNNISIKKNDLLNQTATTEEYINDLSNKIDSSIKEKNIIINQFSEQKQRLSSFQYDFQKNEDEIQSIQDYLNKYQSEIQHNKNIREESSRKVTEIKIQINEIEFNISSLKSENQRINIELDEHNLKIIKNKDNIKNAQKEISEKKQQIVFAQNKNILLKENSQEKQNQLKLLDEEKIKLSSQSENLEKENLQHLEYISKIKNEKTRLELLKEQLEEKKSRISNDIWEKYELTIASAQVYLKPDAKISQMRLQEAKLKNQIREMGTVNVNAIDEYNKIKERFDFLSNQRQDVIYAEENLKSIISELSELMENQFKEQFKIINENFGKVFFEIFGGGKGYIKLSDENNVLNSGIEIVAQPPGKSIQNMTLLSGGERALTAIALLFAILKMKPSPFCILDEIEAALDDANVKRYADYLKRFSKNTQFIIITHRKGSMEAADILYGITMQEQGVSKLVSVKFKDSEQYSIKQE